MKYGLTKRHDNIVLVLPDGSGIELCRCKVAKKANVRPLSAREAGIVNTFLGELPRMTEAAYTRPEYRNALLEAAYRDTP